MISRREETSSKYVYVFPELSPELVDFFKKICYVKKMDEFVKKWIPPYSFKGISNVLGIIQGPIF